MTEKRYVPVDYGVTIPRDEDGYRVVLLDADAWPTALAETTLRVLDALGAPARGASDDVENLEARQQRRRSGD